MPWSSEITGSSMPWPSKTIAYLVPYSLKSLRVSTPGSLKLSGGSSCCSSSSSSAWTSPVFSVNVLFLLLSLLTNVDNKTSSSAFSSSSTMCSTAFVSTERLWTMGETWGDSSITIGGLDWFVPWLTTFLLAEVLIFLFFVVGGVFSMTLFFSCTGEALLRRLVGYNVSAFLFLLALVLTSSSTLLTQNSFKNASHTIPDLKMGH